MKNVDELLKKHNLIIVHEESNCHEEWYLFDYKNPHKKITIQKTYDDIKRYVFCVYGINLFEK